EGERQFGAAGLRGRRAGRQGRHAVAARRIAQGGKEEGVAGMQVGLAAGRSWIMPAAANA
ncbi:MAG: hypothetical protein JWP65_279, partial [Ramlibacter sp.]|nr:hypothetical protein [Ramlibacter sp.]